MAGPDPGARRGRGGRMARTVRGARRRALFVALFAVVVLVLGVGLPLGAAGVVRAAAARAVSAVGGVLLVKNERDSGDDGGSGKVSEKSADAGKKDAGKESGKKDGGNDDSGDAAEKDSSKKDAAKKDASEAGGDRFAGGA